MLSRTVPSLPVSSIMTHHFIPFPKSAVVRTTITPQFETGSDCDPVR